jgi:hypothetical protein
MFSVKTGVVVVVVVVVRWSVHCALLFVHEVVETKRGNCPIRDRQVPGTDTGTGTNSRTHTRGKTHAKPMGIPVPVMLTSYISATHATWVLLLLWRVGYYWWQSNAP